MTLKLIITDEDDEEVFSYASPQDSPEAENTMCSLKDKPKVKALLEEAIEVLGDSQFKDEE
jgi:hypothetical protein